MRAPIRRPPPVGRNDRVRVVAPAGAVRSERLDAGVELLGRRLRLVVPPGVRARHGYLAGDDAHRLGAIDAAFADSGCRAVIAARGGFGTTRILDRIDLARLERDPIWVVGSSDLTALLLRLYAELGLASIHGPMVAGLDRQRRDLEALAALLAGERLPPEALTGLAPGVAEGPLLGGNLTILAHLCGALDPAVYEGAVLFFEEVGERPFRVDRCLTQLWRTGVLERVAGVVVGDLTGCEAAAGPSAREVVGEHLAGLGCPVAEGYPAAHGDRNLPFVHGAAVRLEVEPAGTARLEETVTAP